MRRSTLAVLILPFCVATCGRAVQESESAKREASASIACLDDLPLPNPEPTANLQYGHSVAILSSSYAVAASGNSVDRVYLFGLDGTQLAVVSTNQGYG